MKTNLFRSSIHMFRGKFIVFEGIDGSGKSTALKSASSALSENGIIIAVTREPTDGMIGSMIHSFMTGAPGFEFDERVIAALFAADRLDHILRPDGIIALLNSGSTVLCDRFWLSSLAYQSGAYGMLNIADLNRGISEIIKPDLTLYYMVSAETALSRIDSRGEKKEYYERRDRLERTLSAYSEAIELRKNEDNIIIIDGGKTEKEVASDTIYEIMKIIR